MIKSERLIRDRNRLRFAWEQRKQMCQFYAALKETLDTKIEAQEARIEQLEVALSRAVANACEE